MYPRSFRRRPPSVQGMRQLSVLFCLCLLLSLFPAAASAAAPLAPTAQVAAPAAANACPPAPAGLPDIIERPTFCVYYDDGVTTLAQATTVADHTQAYWDRYTALGFLPPLVTGIKLEVRIENAGCNGTAWDNYIKVNNGCFSIAEWMQKVVGHELFHRIQFAYDPDWNPNWSDNAWMYEGTARAVEDKAFANIDSWATALSASSSFNGQVNDYLSNTNVDVTSFPQRYNSALWWTYFSEQYGSTAVEPELGIDAIRSLWQALTTSNDIAAVNSALANLGAGVDFNAAFRFFTAANWLKDLTGGPAAAYNYVDEDQAGNPAPYGPIVPSNGGTISAGTPAVWSNSAVSRYGARYYAAAVNASCPMVNATVHTDFGPAFYHVVVEKGGALAYFESSAAGDFSRSFFNDGITRIVAIAGSGNAAAQADVTMSCVTPTLDIRLPNSSAKSFVGPFNGPGKFLAQVLVTDGTPNGPVVSGLAVNDFKAFVNGLPASITTGAFIQQQYWLLVQAPVQVTDGVYDLEIRLEASGTATTIATDTNAASVEYNGNNLDHVLVIDRSGSMAADDRIEAAQDAAKFYVDITRNTDGLAVVAYNHDVDPAPFAMTSVTTVPDVRGSAKTYIGTLAASGATSIGDGLAEAVAQRGGSPTGNPVCSFVLLSDGMENSAQFWADVQAGVIGSGCPVTAIAFGAESDETLMQTIATATGGPFFFNDVYPAAAVAAATAAAAAPADMWLELGDTYEYALAGAEGRYRLLAERGSVPLNQDEFIPPPDQIHEVLIDASVTDAVFSLDWAAPLYNQDLILKLRMPDGTLVDPTSRPYSFEDLRSEHLGWRIPDPMPGTWELIVNARDIYVAEEIPYQVAVSARTNLAIELLLPDRLGVRPFTGNRIQIPVLLSGLGPIVNANVLAKVTAPDGSVTMVPLFDDGAHDDGLADDGFYNGAYTHVSQAQAVGTNAEGEPPVEPRDEGSYRIVVEAVGDGFQREALGSFSVEEGPDENGNGLPDPYEEENGVSVPGSDADLDGLTALDEYQLGTDPNDSDTDNGGENDGSEFFFGQDPFDPSDDQIEAPEFLTVAPNVGYNQVTYHVREEYVRMELYRATGSAGPWQLRSGELPADGIYQDPADNGTTYLYRFLGIDENDHRSAVIDSGPATPSEDPFLPEAAVIIDGGAPTTPDRSVILSFMPSSEDVELFEDIVAVRLGNSPELAGIEWQTFAQDLPWELAETPEGELATVFAQFRDGFGNESLITSDSILVEGSTPETSDRIYLPIVVR